MPVAAGIRRLDYKCCLRMSSKRFACFTFRANQLPIEDRETARADVRRRHRDDQQGHGSAVRDGADAEDVCQEGMFLGFWA